jgi:hypothetical protein
MLRSLSRLLPVLALSAGLASAAEMEHRLRLAIDRLPDDVDGDGTVTLGATSVDFDDFDGEYDRAGRVTLQYSARIGGQVAAVFGGGFAYGRAELEDDEDSLEEFGGIIEGGVSFRLAPTFDLEAVVPVGFGIGRVSGIDDEEVSYYDAALLLRPVVTLAERWQLFAEVGYIIRRESIEYDVAFDEEDDFHVEIDLEQDGLIAGLGVGVVF